MKKFIPYEKLSKKEKKKIDKLKRGLWNINPITRKKETSYKRDKDIPIEDKDDDY